MYRLNTYPLIHRGLLHALLNAVALVPLLERFESEHGTLLTGAMFAGRMFTICLESDLHLLRRPVTALSTLPAVGYLLIERGLFRQNTALLGAR